MRSNCDDAIALDKDREPAPFLTGPPTYGYPHLVPTHQGRGAEHSLSRILISPGDHVPGNMYFTTTRAHLELAGGTFHDVIIDEAHDPACEHPFKGNVDLAKLDALVQRYGARNVPYISVAVLFPSPEDRVRMRVRPAKRQASDRPRSSSGEGCRYRVRFSSAAQIVDCTSLPDDGMLLSTHRRAESDYPAIARDVRRYAARTTERAEVDDRAAGGPQHGMLRTTGRGAEADDVTTGADAVGV